MIRSDTAVEAKSMHTRYLRCLVALLLCIGLQSAAARPLEQHASAGGVYLIDWRGDFSAAQQDKLRAWLDHMGETISLLHGEWPRARIRIAFEPYSNRGPVPFAQILRNAPEGIRFLVDPREPLESFVADWTAYHEFGHLFIPYPGRADIWFSEGLASYYQNILQVRAGVLTADDAKQRYTAAFQRGTDDDEDSDLTLGDLSARMMERRAFMRVYWSGALYFLKADTVLRTAHDMSLDDILREFGYCCLEDGRELRGRAMATEFDRIAGSEIFVPLYDRYESSNAMPPWRQLMKSAPLDAILGANP